MINQATINKLIEMRLTSMADAFRIQEADPSMKEVSFDDRFGLIVDSEYTNCKNNRLKQLIKNAEFDQPSASVADINYSSRRKLNKDLINRLASCEYIADYRNIFITRASGSGKSHMTCAFGMEACKHYYNTKYVRLPDLPIDLKIARENGTYKKVLARYANPILLILDEWLLLKPSQDEQLGGDASPFADAIFDRIVHDGYVIDIVPVDPSKDLSMREVYGLSETERM